MKWVSDTWPIQGEAEHGCQAGNKARDYFTFSAACKKWLFGVGWATIAVTINKPKSHSFQAVIDVRHSFSFRVGLKRRVALIYNYWRKDDFGLVFIAA